MTSEDRRNVAASEMVSNRWIRQVDDMGEYWSYYYDDGLLTGQKTTAYADLILSPPDHRSDSWHLYVSYYSRETSIQADFPGQLTPEEAQQVALVAFKLEK